MESVFPLAVPVRYARAGVLRGDSKKEGLIMPEVQVDESGCASAGGGEWGWRSEMEAGGTV